MAVKRMAHKSEQQIAVTGAGEVDDAVCEEKRPRVWVCDPSVCLPLATLAFQTGMPFLIRLSRSPSSAGDQYDPAVLTFLAEGLKVIFALAILHCSESERTRTVKATVRRFTSAANEMRGLVWPAVLYFASNVTSIYALILVRSYIFSAVMNARIVFAAILSYIILRKPMNLSQQHAIVIIFFAATILCLEDTSLVENGDEGNSIGPYSLAKHTIGVILSICAAVGSAAGGVFMEKYFTRPEPSHTHTHACAHTQGYECVCHTHLGAHESVSSELESDSAEGVYEVSHTSVCVRAPLVQTYTPVNDAIKHTPHTLHTRADTHNTSAQTLLWEQQGVLAVFSGVFAAMYIMLFRPWSKVFVGWGNPMVAVVMVTQAVQGVIVAATIQRCGIVFRLIIGMLSICLLIVIEAVAYREVVKARELMAIGIVMVGSTLYKFGGSGTSTVSGNSTGTDSALAGDKCSGGTKRSCLSGGFERSTYSAGITQGGGSAPEVGASLGGPLVRRSWA